MSYIDAINFSSPRAIEEAAIRLRDERRLPSNRWLSKWNRYSKDVVKKLIDDDANSVISKYQNQLAEYVAASAMIHCNDGWNFLSRSVDAYLNNDITTSIFMAYYAELRAAMSFFACDGIGIFKQKHYWFRANGQIESFNGGTHDVVKNLFETYSNCNHKNKDILSILEYDGVSFIDWLDAANVAIGSPITSALAKDWLNFWGFDLSSFLDDHNIRNNVSYRPQNINFSGEKTNFQNSLEFILELWKVTEPTQSNRLNLLDKYLLKNTLMGIYILKKGKKAKGKDYKNYINQAIINLGKSTDSRLSSFLHDEKTTISPQVFLEAKKTATNNDYNFEPKPVISRALILLRLSSAATVNLYKKAGIENSELSFWWNQQGNHKGFWNDDSEVDDITDLWVDLNESIELIEKSNSLNKPECDIHSCHEENPLCFWYLQQFQRVGLWATKL